MSVTPEAAVGDEVIEVASPADQIGTEARASHRRGTNRRLLALSLAAGAALIGFIIYAVAAASRHSSGGAFPTSSVATLPRDTRAPAFSLPRLGGGAPVSLSGIAAGRPAIVNFFASWCPDCRAELSAFGSASRRAGAKIAFIGVDSNDEDPHLATSLLAKAGDRYPVGIDGNGHTAISYLVPGLPTTFFLDRHGRIVGETLGTLTTADLERWVADLTAARAPAGPTG